MLASRNAALGQTAHVCLGCRIRSQRQHHHRPPPRPRRRRLHTEANVPPPPPERRADREAAESAPSPSNAETEAGPLANRREPLPEPRRRHEPDAACQSRSGARPAATGAECRLPAPAEASDVPAAPAFAVHKVRGARVRFHASSAGVMARVAGARDPIPAPGHGGGRRAGGEPAPDDAAPERVYQAWAQQVEPAASAAASDGPDATKRVPSGPAIPLPVASRTAHRPFPKERAGMPQAQPRESRPAALRRHVSAKGTDPAHAAACASRDERRAQFATRRTASDCGNRIMAAIPHIVNATDARDADRAEQMALQSLCAQPYRPISAPEPASSDVSRQPLRMFLGEHAPSGMPAATHTLRTPANGFAWQRPVARCPLHARLYHSSRLLMQHAVAAPHRHEPPGLGTVDAKPTAHARAAADDPRGIRAQLRKWNQLHGHEEMAEHVAPPEDISHDFDTYNSLTRLPNENAINRHAQTEESREADSMFAVSGEEAYDGFTQDAGRFLRMGDLVEVEYPQSERESIIAVYIRRFGPSMGLFFTRNGKWMHLKQTAAQYSIPSFVDPKDIEPILKYLPDVQTPAELDELRAKSFGEDLSVPRSVAAPLVNRLTAFYNEALEVYRRHANALDNAHTILAHETDLRYGSLESAAMALLKLPADQLPLPALYTVRKALANGGFAFNIDRRSHRITGYLQIRSKEQVRMVEEVRDWIREWQDDLARAPSMNDRQAARHRPSAGASILYSFVEKSKRIVAKQRRNRQPTASRNVGPSKTRLPYTAAPTGCMRIEVGTEFTAEEQNVIRFLEAWCCSAMFGSIPRLNSLPPLILSATGLYNNIDGHKLDLNTACGFLFLQELGVVMPHENRVRFDQHLLLPSSQHSKPLQNLMTSVLGMRDSHNFHDSMSHIRHDWGDLPVYCIDDPGAHEIDDGISVEKAGRGADGRERHWLHVHIANPTAFFSRDHPLAKMARHMGETIYMPERNYVMLPVWATQRHFSLAPNRPCLTFSAKLDPQGNILEYKIRPGVVRNVMRITYHELGALLGESEHDRSDEILITVNGTPPAPHKRRSRVRDLSLANVEEMKAIRGISTQRNLKRQRAGGVFFNTVLPDPSVWQVSNGNGLLWTHPYRKGSRTVYGDPVVQVKTHPFRNWFSSGGTVSELFVSESMLLCCEVAATYCADRHIPFIFRGTETAHSYVPADHSEHARKLAQAQDILDRNGTLPMYLGLPYVQSLGYTVLRTSPLKHKMLGMDYYAKATSPLRRYGDMINHWQIEAALRHEAATGRSLAAAPDDDGRGRGRDRDFLPFSAALLDTITLGLQPRENMILRAKNYATDFWTTYALFHKFYFGRGSPEGSLADVLTALDPASDGHTVAVFVNDRPDVSAARHVNANCLQLGTKVTMARPEDAGLLPARQGDLWEARLTEIQLYGRYTHVVPTRLIGRNAM